MKNTVALLGGRAELDRDTVPMLNKTEGDEMDGDTTVALLGGRAGTGWRCWAAEGRTERCTPRSADGQETGRRRGG